MPRRVKFRKSQRGKWDGKATRGNEVSFGEFGLQSLESGWVSARQIEAGRVAATHFLGREGKLWVRVFPHKSVTKKPLETRMGKGKGEPEMYVAVVKEGSVIYELAGVPEEVAKDTLARCAHKMPLRMRFIKRRHF